MEYSWSCNQGTAQVKRQPFDSADAAAINQATAANKLGRHTLALHVDGTVSDPSRDTVSVFPGFSVVQYFVEVIKLSYQQRHWDLYQQRAAIVRDRGTEESGWKAVHSLDVSGRTSDIPPDKHIDFRALTSLIRRTECQHQMCYSVNLSCEVFGANSGWISEYVSRDPILLSGETKTTTNHLGLLNASNNIHTNSVCGLFWVRAARCQIQ